MMRILLCGGGTAGHVMPAIAISEIIEKSFPDASIAFAGRTGGGENDAYLKTKHPLYTTDICGISRSLSVNNIKTIFKVIKSGRVAKSIIEDFKPDIIIGTGGYVCYPFIHRGQRMQIKTVIHESNVYPGLVTRLLGAKCDMVMLNLGGTRRYLKNVSHTLVVGNPTRQGFGAMTKAEARRRLNIPESKTLILSFGGSLGSAAINNAVIGSIKKRNSSHSGIYHVHATGKGYYEGVKEKHPELFSNSENIRILPYVEDMPLYLTAADLAVTRSGAITISELLKCGIPSVLIPSPNVTANHQYKNAKYMRDNGAALLIEEKDLTSESLTDTVNELLSSGERMRKMSDNAKRLSPKNTDLLIQKALAGLIER